MIEKLVKNAVVAFDYNDKHREGTVVVADAAKDYVKVEMTDCVKTFNISKMTALVIK